MKKIFAILLLVAGAAFAEASFDQIENLIEQRNYAAAEHGLEGIIANHPNSAKAYYAMAQAQAGLGNLEKARYALDKATGLDPDLKFASSSNVASLREAITPQVAKIERAEPSHFWRNLVLALVLGGILYWCYIVYKRDEEEDKPTGGSAPKPTPPAPPAAAATPVSPTPAAPSSFGYSDPRASTPTPPPVQPAPVATTTYVAPQPTIVHHTTTVQNNNDGFVTGMLVGEMLSNHHDHTRVVEREVIREVPAPSRDTSWDTPSTPAPSRSSSWDDSSSSSSSSWGSSSSSDSSWSSSSDSSSSSSWD